MCRPLCQGLQTKPCPRGTKRFWLMDLITASPTTVSPRSCYQDNPLPFCALLVSKFCLQSQDNKHGRRWHRTLVCSFCKAETVNSVNKQKSQMLYLELNSAKPGAEPVPGVKCAEQVRVQNISLSSHRLCPLYATRDQRTSTDQAHTGCTAALEALWVPVGCQPAIQR